MTITSIVATTATYYRTESINTVYATARTTSNNFTSSGKMGQLFATPNYRIYCMFFKFDTSSIPDTDVVSDVKMRLVAVEDISTYNFDVQICEQNWSASDPLADGNRETVFDGCLAETNAFLWRNTSGMSLNTQYEGASMNTAYVNKTGSTYYSLRSKKFYDNITPITYEYVTFALPADATASYRPTLIVTHAPGASNTQGLLILF